MPRKCVNCSIIIKSILYFVNKHKISDEASTCKLFEKSTLTKKKKERTVFRICWKKKSGCRKVADAFNIRKTKASNILKEQKLKQQYEQFYDKSKKRRRPGKYKISMTFYMSGTKIVSP